jgi:hypothetical protein
MPSFEPAAYGPAFEELLRRAPVNPLDAGQADGSMRVRLEALTEESFRPHTIRDHNMASGCRAGLWLRFNYLDQAHKISQDIDTPEGSYWHGLVHRREGDFDNAKYWFRQAGKHPVFQPLNQSAKGVLNQDQWDPFAFIDVCAAAVRGQKQYEAACLEAQRIEWELLFDYCWRRAIE